MSLNNFQLLLTIHLFFVWRLTWFYVSSHYSSFRFLQFLIVALLWSFLVFSELVGPSWLLCVNSHMCACGLSPVWLELSTLRNHGAPLSRSLAQFNSLFASCLQFEFWSRLHLVLRKRLRSFVFCKSRLQRSALPLLQLYFVFYCWIGFLCDLFATACLP